MRRWLPVLALLAGLTSFISCKRTVSGATQNPAGTAQRHANPPNKIGKPSTDLNPFDRYLADAKANWPEPALTHFANECQVDLDVNAPQYAQMPGKRWILVKDLSGALKDQETDLYGTAAVWHVDDRILVERWGMELDTGDYYRLLYCIEKKKIALVDSVSWSVSLNNDSSKDTGWGYEHLWRLGPNGKFDTVLRRFIDLREQPIAEPKLDAETEKDLNEENVGIQTWADLQLPNRLLR